jgi:hypothetical protein
LSVANQDVYAKSSMISGDFDSVDELFDDPELLLSVVDQPGVAGNRWRAMRAARPGASTGVIELSYGGQLLADARLSDELWPLWSYLIAMIEEYLADGVGQAAFPNRPVHIVLRDRGDTSYFSVGDVELDVHAPSLIAGLLEGAESFFVWLQEECDEAEAAYELAQIEHIKAELNEVDHQSF